MAAFSTSGLNSEGMYNHNILKPNRNKYEENQMLFFQDKKSKRGKQADLTRPRTVQEVQKL